MPKLAESSIPFGYVVTGVPKFEPNATRRELTPDEWAEFTELPTEDPSTHGYAFADVRIEKRE